MNDRQAELDQNIVADNLVSFYKKIEPYSKLILTGVVVVVVALIGMGLYSSDVTAKRSDATLQLLMQNPEVASQYPGTVAASWSSLFAGNDNLAQGIDALYQDRDEAETLLAEAKDQFVEARAGSDDPILVSRASFGLAMACESLGEIEDAIKAYQRTIDANESEAMVETAQSRIDRLSNPSTIEFVNWFKEQDFAPADPSLPPELPGESALPDLPDLDLPGLNLGGNLNSEEPESKDMEGGLELPADDDQQTSESEEATSETPAEDAAATEDSVAPEMTEEAEASLEAPENGEEPGEATSAAETAE